MKCHYCENSATKTLVWLKNKRCEPARIKLPWCGCDLQVALKKFWTCPYTVVEGDDYEVENLQNCTEKSKSCCNDACSQVENKSWLASVKNFFGF